MNNKKADERIYAEQLYKVHWQTYRERKDKPFVVLEKESVAEDSAEDYDPANDIEDGVGEIDFGEDFYDGFGFYSADEIERGFSF